jgi:hypothetical protein
MRYEQVKSLRDVEFKRLCGVKRHPFEAMREELEAAATKTKPGRPGKLSLEDQLLMTLWYWREYPTLFHLGTALGVSEGTASRRVRWVEDVLIGAGSLPCPRAPRAWPAWRVSTRWWRWMPPRRPWSGLKKTAPVLQRQA